jgi:hypothetical protein
VQVTIGKPSGQLSHFAGSANLKELGNQLYVTENKPLAFQAKGRDIASTSPDALRARR